MASDVGNDTPEVPEDEIPKEPVYLWDLMEITPECAIVSSLVNSPAGSGFVAFPDFATAVDNAWYLGLEAAYQDNGAPRLMGEAAPPELRAGRRAFSALLDRYAAAGYSPDMTEELVAICDQYCQDYRVLDCAVLPHDLEKVLDMAYPDPDEDAEEQDDESAEADERRASAPARDAFDLANPEHLAWLQRALQYLADL